MDEMSLESAMQELSAAEEFLEFFGVPFDAKVVEVARLHILQRFHDYIQARKVEMPEDEDGQRAFYRALLEQAYQDFLVSDAVSEKVFKVFRSRGPQTVFIPVSDIQR
jgi:nitrogenase-stabilizing/protective protein